MYMPKIILADRIRHGRAYGTVVFVCLSVVCLLGRLYTYCG